MESRWSSGEARRLIALSESKSLVDDYPVCFRLCDGFKESFILLLAFDAGDDETFPLGDLDFLYTPNRARGAVVQSERFDVHHLGHVAAT